MVLVCLFQALKCCGPQMLELQEREIMDVQVVLEMLIVPNCRYTSGEP